MLPIITLMLHNPMFIGMGGAGLVGGILMTLRQSPARIWKAFLHLFTVDVDIKDTDQAFYWVSLFLSQHKSATKARTLRVQDLGRRASGHPADNSHMEDWFFSPGQGTIWIMHGKRPTTITRTIIQNEKGADKESFQIRMLGRSQEPVKAFINQAKQLTTVDIRQKIWTPSNYGWAVADRRHPRKLETIVLAEGQMDRIYNDLKNFYENEEWYQERGIPYHRGLLLQGPPGTGKTSLIAALAGALGKDVAILALSSVVSDVKLIDLISEAPTNCIIAMEDIDCTNASINREEKSTGISLSTFLNVLDGVQTPEGSVFIMTTNHPEKLDSALIRPGRCDVVETLGLMSKHEQIKLSGLFFEEPIWIDKEVSPAQMQGILMRHADDRSAALAELQQI
jgi:chaperone BCS1